MSCSMKKFLLDLSHKEPSRKRQRRRSAADSGSESEAESAWASVRAVLAPELTAPVAAAEAWADAVPDRRQREAAVKELNRVLPEPRLSHLKRVRGSDGSVLLALCQGDYEHCPPESARSVAGLAGRPTRVRVPAKACSTKEQSQAARQLWPVNFHPDKEVEDALGPGAGVEARERRALARAMRTCLAAIREARTGPGNDRGPRHASEDTGQDERGSAQVHGSQISDLEKEDSLGCDSKPLQERNVEDTQVYNSQVSALEKEDGDGQDSTRLAPADDSKDSKRQERNDITDSTSKSQDDDDDDDWAPDAAAAAVEPTSGRVVALALDRRRQHPLQHPAARLVDLVAQGQGGGCGWRGPGRGELLGPAPEGQYLCTGLDVVVTREPCAYCAMALTHARARRVVVGRERPDRGALVSKARLHTLPGLNHRLKVFTGLYRDEC